MRTAKPNHSLGLQAYNQARIASYACRYIGGVMALTDVDPALSAAYYAYDPLFTMARKAMREMAIVHAASVFESDSRSTGMFGLIAETRKTRPELAGFCDRFEEQLKAHRPAFFKAERIRNTLIAHRSKEVTAQEVQEHVRLSDTDLAAAVEVWLAAALELCAQLQPDPFRPGPDVGHSAEQLLRDIAAFQAR